MRHWWNYIWLVFLFFLLAFTGLKAQSNKTTSANGEFILVRLTIENKVSYDMDALLIENQIYLPVPYIFDLLKIRYRSNTEKTLYSVSFPNENNPVSINLKTITNTSSNVNELPVVSWYEDETYMAANFFASQFNIEFNFDYRRLTLRLRTKHPLPLIQELNRKNRYQYLNERNTVNSELSSTTKNVESKRYFANGLIADWRINNNYNIYRQSNITGNIGVGGQLLGGNINMHGSASQQNGIHWESMRGNWTYPIHSTSLIQQVQLGDIRRETTIDPIFSGFRGFMVSNRPNLRPVYFNNQTFSGQLPDNWDVEFYVNRQLEDYELGESRSAFDFSSPLLYGTNYVELKYYDDKGFHHQEQYLIQVPYDFLQPGKVEYNLSAGEYTSLSGYNYWRSNLKLGIATSVTMGGGVFQNIDHPQDDDTYPYIQTWLRLGKRMVVSGSYMFNHIASGSIRYTFSGSQIMNLNFSRYEPNNILNRQRKLYEASLNTSFPVNLSFLKFSNYINIRYIERELSDQQLNVNSGISATLPLRVNMRVNGWFTLRNENIEKFKSDQSNIDFQLSRRIFKKVLLRTNAKYSNLNNAITNVGVKVDYRITSQIRLDASLNRNMLVNTNQYLVRFRWDLPFARHTSSARSNGGLTTLNQYTSGSILMNRNSGIKFDDQRKVGRATLVINPFLDKNNNSRRDKDEPIFDEISATLFRESRFQEIRTNDRIVENLIPYERYTIEINPFSFSDPFLRAKNTSYSFRVIPNTVNNLNVPIVVVGEVSGLIESTEKETDVRGLTVHLISEDSDFSDETQTYTGGYYYYTGLLPGKYTAFLDQKQLKKQALIAEKDSLSFIVAQLESGDIVENVNFSIQRPEKEVKNFNVGEESDTEEEFHSNEELTKEKSENQFAIQIAAFAIRKNAEKFVKGESEINNELIRIYFNESNNLYKCLVGQFETKELARSKLADISELYPGSYIIKVNEAK